MDPQTIEQAALITALIIASYTIAAMALGFWLGTIWARHGFRMPRITLKSFAPKQVQEKFNRWLEDVE